MNRLANASSPYLRAHADNPVAWFPWGAEAFALAAERDVPVLVSIGYSTCHWCHVMARESFQDPETARVMNDGFVSIKVDREEHPEVDAAYLDAASAFTPHLGWPLTVFASPEGRVFYAGTYFPPEPRPPQPSFRQVLAAVREAWTERRSEVDATGSSLRDALAAAATAPADAPPTLAQLAGAARAVAQREDRDDGGFAAGPAFETPKFPNTPVLRFLQHPALAEQAPEAASVASRALAAMARSDLHDTVDGGFFRYATRRDWSVPHYERMLTDNAGLVEVALAAGDEAVATDAARFLVDVLQLPSGGIAAAQDSESVIDGQRTEGGYYLAADRSGLTPPALDAKVVTGWNGHAIAALAAAGTRTDPRFVEAARWAADAVLESNVADDGTLRRASLDEVRSSAPATLEDYGGLARGLLALARATGEVVYAERARALVDQCLDGDGIHPPGGGDPVLVAQGMQAHGTPSDGASPSGPSAFAAAALDLWRLGAGERYRDAAARLVRAAADVALSSPLAHGAILDVAVGLATPPRQVVVVGEADAEIADIARRLAADVVAVVSPGQARSFAEAGFELFAGKVARGGEATAYDCRAFTCALPTTDPSQLG
ncbi:thioredoxin domain-containing protein [Microbacterium sp. NPDC090007]|uniref:thioredoxin domain-containing protein n=1 Tax=Microbacterium sp. NPDC090007 TaxID=3364204 RepID=UPI0037F11B0D